MSLLTIANVQFAFDDRPLLNGVNLTLERRQRIGVVGRNGCGKSTLMKMIAGLDGLKPDAGQIQLTLGAASGYLTQSPEFEVDRTLRPNTEGRRTAARS